VSGQIRRTRRGDFRLRLSRDERQLLRALPGQLRQLLGTDDPSLARLYPPAYADDPEAQAEYEHLTRGELDARRREALRTMETTVDAERLDEPELEAWLQALEDLRLVLGTRLGVTEEVYTRPLSPRDPRAPELALYGYLSWLQEQAVAALAEGIRDA
jgi:hypothetical protein